MNPELAGDVAGVTVAEALALLDYLKENGDEGGAS